MRLAQAIAGLDRKAAGQHRMVRSLRENDSGVLVYPRRGGARQRRFWVTQAGPTSVRVSYGEWRKGGILLQLSRDSGKQYKTVTGLTGSDTYYVYIYHTWATNGLINGGSCHAAASTTVGDITIMGTTTFSVKQMYARDKVLLAQVLVETDRIVSITPANTGNDIQEEYPNFVRPYDIFDITTNQFKIRQGLEQVQSSMVTPSAGTNMTAGGGHYLSPTITGGGYVYVKFDRVAGTVVVDYKAGGPPSPSISERIRPLWYVPYDSLNTQIYASELVDYRYCGGEPFEEQPTISTASTSHSASDWAGSNAADDALGSKINQIIAALQGFKVIT